MNRAIYLLISLLTGTLALGTQAGEITLNLKETDIRSLIETVSSFTGKNFIVDPRVKGKVTVISARPVDEKELYETFLSILNVHGFIATESGESVKIIPNSYTREHAPVQSIPQQNDTLLTRVIALKHVPAAKIVPALRPLLPKNAHIAVYSESNSIIVSDTARNTQRIESIINRIDQPFDQEIEIVKLQHATAAEVVRVIEALRTKKESVATSDYRVIADQRTNSILVSGAVDQRPRIRSIIAHLDTPLSTDTGNTQVVFLRYAKAETLSPILTGVVEKQYSKDAEKQRSSRIQVQSEPETNSIILTAPPEEMQSMLSIVRQLDIRRAQVMVEAIIAEISSDQAAELGLQFASGKNDFAGATSFGGSGSNLVQLKSDPFSIGKGLTLGVGSFTSDKLNIGLLIRALAGDAATNILSTPTLVTMDNEEAEIVVGQNVPFITGSYSNSSSSTGVSSPFQTIQRHDVGLHLKIKPQINEGDAIKLEIEQEVSSLSSTSAGTADVVTNKRSINTSVMVNDRDLIILGGLMDDNLRESAESVPLLGDIPILGHAFQYKKSQLVKRNLMVFIRPTIIRDAAILNTASHEKYNLLRTQQLQQQNSNIFLMPETPKPLLPTFDDSLTLPPPYEETSSATDNEQSL